MGLAGRKPLLPAPTESLVDDSTVEEPQVSEEVATDLSQRTDRTHHTIPEDGSPITISTKKTTAKLSKIAKSAQNSQTSLLIEYFEGAKGADSNRRPSVRVKVVPSSKRSKSKGKGDPHLILTEERRGHSGRRSTSRRISLSSTEPQVAAAINDVTALNSLHIPEPRVSTPPQIETQQNSDMSELGASPEARYIAAPSDISSMPADSMLGAQQSTLFAPPSRVYEGSNVSSLPPEESIISTSELNDPASLRPPVMPRERNPSNERITQKVIEKLSNKPRQDYVKAGYGQTSKSSSRSASRDPGPASYERASMKGKNFRETESTLSPSEPSLLSNSVISAGGRSDHSAVTNPKLLQTVEDAIRRLILPELKELKKDQRQHSRSGDYDNDYSDLSETSVVREKSTRRSTSGEKSQRRRSSKDHAERPGSGRRKSSHREVDYDSLSDTSSRREASVSSISTDDPKKHKSRRARDLAAAGLAGAALTAAALESKDSEESLQRKRRRKRSKSQSSHSVSLAESDEIFHKHKVPPMPMQSDINSDLTRSSILSSNTEGSRTPVQREVQKVARGSTREHISPNSGTPSRRSGDLRQSLGTHHGNFSEHNLSSNKLAEHEREDEDTLSPETERYQSFSAEDLLEDPERMRLYERNLHTQHPIRRGLSPIQSVASYQTTEPNRNSMLRKSADSIASMRRRQQQLKEEVSISSFASASPDLKKTRPHGISLENRSEILRQHENDPNRSPEYQSIGVHDRFGEDDHDNYRDSYTTDDQSMNEKRLSQMTDASSDVQYVDKVTAGQHVVPVSGARPEFVPAPFGVESGVASLVEPSVLSMRESQPSQKGSFVHENGSSQSLPRQIVGARMTSPLKDQPVSVDSEASMRQPQYAQQVDLSPPQSPARSYEESELDYIPESHERSRSRSPLPSVNFDVEGSPESEITTNPSVIHGPIGGLGAGHPDPWMADTATPPMPSQGGMSRDFSSGAIDLIPEGLNVSQRNTYEPKTNTYTIGQPMQAPVGNKDEGYATGEGDNHSPAPLTKTVPPVMTNYDFEDPYGGKVHDPFTAKRNKYMSGLSQGMSPLYDGATGKGVDRIQSQDIVALMEHLTVRDAHRNARDTEILVTLVRSAADMRNSFEEMRQYIAEQDALIMQTADKQHQHTQKVVGGPRQMPANVRAAPRSSSQEDEPNKRRNVFKRALQGLGSKNNAELQNIESMLMHLLDEVEGLRSQHVSAGPTPQPRTNSVVSEDVARPATDTGYEPEGRAGTASSGGDRSVFFSNNSSRQGQYSGAKRVPENRVSTVMEGDEEYDDYNDRRPGSQRTPRGLSPVDDPYQRGQSEPLHTPPRMHDEDEITPTSYHSSDKKHKTFSSFLPKQFVSRWSKTTASTEPEYRQSTQAKPRPYSGVSNSGSNMHEYEYEHNPEDRLRSATSLQDEVYYRDQENRPPSPLVPSALSDNPKYQAHRDSQNMEHPQPRQGPTGRYQYTLENAAQRYHNDEALSPISQMSSHRQWDNMNSQQTQQSYAHHNMSPISDGGAYNERPGSASSLTRRNNGPPRPPKISDTASDLSEPLVPQRPPKVPHGTMSPSTYVDDVRAARAGSPAFDKSPIAILRSPNAGNVGRKPSGPRPLSASSNKETQKRARFTNSPIQSVGSGGRY
ncbi:hypothetical protein LTR70_001250 [Exophiala xenobiotica]|uniref:Transaldolase n=1 Tax=Lithohypha guttulata TaxID=1690604 RepID=A0ABR0KKJ2_9EURO|nr:hypothetical protein LTR24_001501 [Lithohypha guttulata]KAK5328225.1 hypothetical protein LTR70_001250 [Exophiala xenobiotica]